MHFINNNLQRLSERIGRSEEAIQRRAELVD